MIKYSIKKNRRARRISITVKHDGGVVVTLPLFAPAFMADRFVAKKADWIRATQHKLEQRFKNKILLRQTKKDYVENKTRALSFIKERVAHYNDIYQFSYRSISVKNQKSRWGSCSARGNLNFNYALIHLPQELADYIVVHELCHLKEMNHGPRFWALVAKTIPDHKERRRILRQNFISVK